MLVGIRVRRQQAKFKTDMKSQPNHCLSTFSLRGVQPYLGCKH